MSKKSKKHRQPNIPPQAFRAVAAERDSKPESPGRSSSDFNPDYSYVVKDLKRIGTLAGSFILLLIVLSIFLR